MILFDLQSLSKIYVSEGGPIAALKDISIQFQKGEFVVLSGPSGSGKSTLLHILGTLDRPSAGKVFFENTDLSTLSQAALSDFRLRKIGFVFQAYNLIPVLTALENVEYVLLLQGVPEQERRSKARALLDRVGLGRYTKTRPPYLSGGQQQRVAVARACASNPEVILADEPTANLDSKTGSELIDLFLELNRSLQITFIIASHDAMVMQKAGRLIQLHDGEMVL